MYTEQHFRTNILFVEGTETMEKFPINCNVTGNYGEKFLGTVIGYTFNSTGELILIITKYDFVKKTVTKDCLIHPLNVKKL